jgi:hyperosmotically inducible protein
MNKTTSMRRIVIASVMCTLMSGTFAVSAGQAQSTKPDNTKVNERDRNPNATTADQQKMNSADTELTKKIRSALIADKSLSSYAHNVKVISQEGTVTLKGPVRSEEEKAAVEAKANEAAGGAKVVSELSVATKSKKPR